MLRSLIQFSKGTTSRQAHRDIGETQSAGVTHVVIVAGDSGYIPLAQRRKRLGRYVVGIGVAGSSSKSLAAACDEFVPVVAWWPATSTRGPVH
jgi:NYN domain-containing protein